MFQDMGRYDTRSIIICTRCKSSDKLSVLLFLGVVDLKKPRQKQEFVEAVD